ncbi:MAG: helix-turn-helix domain-containing protein [Bdellovibrionales bacterium]|nr:helix-turn-helix domain-containing protein [Bdellovibrionales bacterium]
MTLGRILRERRTELGKSIEQISAATRIHVRILSALEDDRYADLPARTFTRGFITSYAKALRLDADQLFRDHHDFLEQKFTERQDRDQGHHGYVFEGKELEQNKRGLIIGASVAAVFAVAVLLVFKPQNHHRKEKHKEFTSEDMASTSPAEDADSDEVITTETPAAVATATAASGSSTPAATATPTEAPKATVTPTPAPTTEPTATPKPTPNASPAPSPATKEPKKDPLNKGDELGPKEFKKKIAFEALEDCYVKYQADGKPPMQFNLRKGRFLVIKAKSAIHFEVNKPEALMYRTKTREYFPVMKSSFNVGDDGSLSD